MSSVHLYLIRPNSAEQPTHPTAKNVAHGLGASGCTSSLEWAPHGSGYAIFHQRQNSARAVDANYIARPLRQVNGAVVRLSFHAIFGHSLFPLVVVRPRPVRPDLWTRQCLFLCFCTDRLDTNRLAGVPAGAIGARSLWVQSACACIPSWSACPRYHALSRHIACRRLGLGAGKRHFEQLSARPDAFP